MKQRIYIRVAKNAYKNKVEATTKMNSQPLHIIRGYGANASKLFLPTVSFAVDFEIPDELFNQAARVVGTINITEDKAMINAEVPAVSDDQREESSAKPN